MKAVILFLLLLTLHGCHEAPPEPPLGSIRLESLDASCTEIWLKASVVESPATVRLLRDGWSISSYRLLFTSGSFTAVQIKKNLIVAVGGIGNLAVVVEGKR